MAEEQTIEPLKGEQSADSNFVLFSQNQNPSDSDNESDYSYKGELRQLDPNPTYGPNEEPMTSDHLKKIEERMNEIAEEIKVIDPRDPNNDSQLNELAKEMRDLSDKTIDFTGQDDSGFICTMCAFENANRSETTNFRNNGETHLSEYTINWSKNNTERSQLDGTRVISSAIYELERNNEFGSSEENDSEDNNS